MEIRLGESIRRLRKESGFTQEQLAEALGVTPGAVHKWESGKATPELEMLVDIAGFFETSVDALLDYGWQKLSMGEAAERIKALRTAGDFKEARQHAEKALQKYPNSFEIVYQSGLMYFLSMDAESAPRAISLLERARKLIDQNPYEDVNEWTILNTIALSYSNMGQYDEAVARLKKNNFNGANNSLIGSELSQHCRKPDEALRYLSEALREVLASLYHITVGYANAYTEKGELQKAREIMQWMLDLCQGLRNPDAVSYMDKGDVRTLTALAEICILQKDEEAAYACLKQARALALRFDAAPDYSLDGVKFYHGPKTMAYDDFGSTAMDGIENHLTADEAGSHLLPLWQKLQRE